MYATRKTTNGTFTSNGKVPLSNKRVEYESSGSVGCGYVVLFALIGLTVVAYFLLFA